MRKRKQLTAEEKCICQVEKTRLEELEMKRTEVTGGRRRRGGEGGGGEPKGRRKRRKKRKNQENS